MKPPKHVKQALRDYSRHFRFCAAFQDKRLADLRTLAEMTADREVITRLRVVADTYESLSDQCRDVADQADEFQKRGDVPASEFAGLQSRVELLNAELLAVTAEARGAAGDWKPKR
jgi:hypothetical protein